MKNLIFIAVFLLLCTPVFASSITQYSVTAEVSENAVNYEMSIVFADYTGNTTFVIYGTPSINLLSDFCSYNKHVLETIVTCKITGDRENVMIGYSSSENLRKQDNYLAFVDEFKVPMKADKLYILIKLPEGTGLVRDQQAYIPDNARVLTDGRRPWVLWEREEIPANTVFDVSIVYEKIIEIQSSRPALIMISIVALFVFGFVFYKYFYLKKDVQVIMPILKKDEKAVLESLVKHGSGVNQKILVKESKYSKAKVSKVLKSLQERKLVKLERVGRSNRVHWGEELKK